MLDVSILGLSNLYDILLFMCPNGSLFFFTEASGRWVAVVTTVKYKQVGIDTEALI